MTTFPTPYVTYTTGMPQLNDNISYTLYVYIAENRRHACPKLQIKIAGEEIQALIDTGCEMSILNENLYNTLRRAGLQCLELTFRCDIPVMFYKLN